MKMLSNFIAPDNGEGTMAKYYVNIAKSDHKHFYIFPLTMERGGISPGLH